MLVLKALHIIAVVAWFAGLFYLPRLFVYHATRKQGEVHALLSTMERRLFRYIMTPAMLMVLAFGASLAAIEWELVRDQWWFWAKLIGVAALVAFHLQCGRYLRAFAGRKPTPSERFFRAFNEIPTLLLIAIVFLVVLRPG
ncbi:MAG: protoporphyrinogen oxidase HemJ [Zetaproteobacteria bacterium]|nr:MAG: protoporphyrinogen oxidase HemJ [Zetaproteobacteria bacterium]